MTISDLALLLLRLAVGLTFAAHGAQKVFGWWKGPGPEGWHGAMERMGFRPPELFAPLSMLVELVGGIALAIGLLTPLAGALLVAQSIVIILHVHWPKGFFNQGGGIEFPLVLGVGALTVALLGPGLVSVDGALRLSIAPEWRAAIAALGIVGGLVALAVPRLREAGARNNLRRT